METEVARRALLDNRRSLTGWLVGTAAYVLLIAAIFPSLSGSADLDRLIQDYPDALKSLFGISGGGSLSSGAGFLDAELFSFMIPLLVLVLAIGAGARLFAGEEDAGRLELVLAYPVLRGRALRAKAAAIAAEVALVSLVVGGAIAVASPVFDLGLTAAHVVAAVAGVLLLGVLYGWVALSVGAATGNEALAVAVPVAYAALSYLVAGLHDLAGWLDPFRFLSPFWWLGTSPLQHGIRGWGALVVAVAAVAAVLVGEALLQRRDLEAG